MLRLLPIAFIAPLCALAQLASPNEAGVAMGHIHFNTNQPEAHRAFWTMLGAKPGKSIGSHEVYRVQNALIIVRKQDASGGSEGSIVNHVGFRIFDLNAALARCRAAGIRIITPPETTAKTHKANVMGPDDVNVELVADSTMAVPIASHHIHFYTPQVDEMRRWYVQTFSAVPGKRDIFEAADLPGINLSYSPTKTAPLATKSRVLDHIGFEVKNLEAFVKKLESSGVKVSRPFEKHPDVGVSVAVVTDPWGTDIELTEGLDQY